ncbi:hypothetical protein [Actinomadura geliboluensis]|uniref:hypothetical protein n=1 Tax=Actinomadura geliboluensis TaxID=882440 RepID=UPI00369F5799
MALDAAYPTSSSVLSTMAQWEAFFAGFSADGVISGEGAEFVPSLNAGGRTAVIGTGAAQIRGFHVDGPSATATAIPAASSQNRVDRLVLRLDRTAASAADWITPVVITGTPSANPTPPALSQTSGGDYDIPIARWTSAANGSLAGLVDERVFAAGQPQEFQSDARPSATRRRIGIERDTNKVLYADGATWRTLWEDSGDVVLPVEWTTVWKAGNTPAIVARRVGSLVTVDIEVTRIATLGVDDQDGSRVCTLPAGMRPSRWKYFSAQFSGAGSSGGISARLQLKSDGSLWCGGVSATVPAGRHLRQTITYMP